MSFGQTYFFCVMGVVLSVILPILRQSLPKPRGGKIGFRKVFPKLWEIAKPYVVLGFFSLLVSFLVLAFAGGTIQDWRTALLMGYAWDSTLQKLKG